jgi:hypothetical protein
MRSTIILCDWAESIQGKLYVQGGGWNKLLSDTPGQFAVAVICRIEYNETNTPYHAVLALVDEDGQPFPPLNPEAGQAPARFEIDFEVGRPPGMRPGQTQVFSFTGKLGGFVFPPGGYRFELDISGHRQDAAEFQAAPNLA